METVNEICGDNRFEVIQRAKEHLIEATNIEQSPDEMKVLDSFLFRAWQMEWLRKYDPTLQNATDTNDKWVSVDEPPKEDGKYLVCTAKNTVYCAKYHAKGKFFGTDMHTHVTHWMPLPKPAKGGAVMRLIDADALKERFKLRIDWLKKDVHDECSKGLFWGAETDVELIDEMPTVDAEPVRHGRWMSFEEYCQKLGADPKTYTGGWSFCSECEKPMRSFNGWNYCPDCGAKMDEEVE